MWVLLPSLLLVITLLALVALQRWRPAFKSYWFVATAGALLAALLTLGLRFSLPQAAHFPGWVLSDGLQFPLSFGLDGFSWSLSFTLLILLLASLLRSVRRASDVSWPIWMPSLALAATGLLAVAAADLLAVALTLLLLDVMIFAQHSAFAPDEGRAVLLEQFALSLGSVLLVLAAWATPASYASLASLLLSVAGGLRLALAAGPRVGTRQPMPAFTTMLRYAPLAAGFVLLRFIQPFSGIALHLSLILLLAAALRWAVLALAPNAPLQHMQRSTAALGLAAAIAGATNAVLGFGLLLLYAETLARLIGHYPQLRRPFMLAGAVFFSGLWFTAAQGASALYSAPLSPLLFAALPLHALLLLGIVQRAGAPSEPPAPDEPWTLAVESIGAVLPLAMFVIAGLILPLPFGGNSAPWWPAIVVLALLAAIWAGRIYLRRSGRQLLPPHFRQRMRLPQWRLPTPRQIAAGLSAALAAVLRLLSSLLEGEAGLLWALLFIALLISIFSQGGLAG